ncbi:MAG: bifunctional aspartate kinase/diaminopimelate decarboxylase [Nannocystaceae bacterium]
MSNRGQSWVVLKFGATSVSTAAEWHTITKILMRRRAENQRVVLVCSAIAGASDLLDASLADAQRGDFRPTLARIQTTHDSLAAKLGLNASEICGAALRELERTLMGVSLLDETTPRQRARVMACGALMASRIGHAFLRLQAVDVGWVDARSCLLATEADPHATPSMRYLAASCESTGDSTAVQTITEVGTPIVITQGGVARSPRGDTVLLGPGGSDTAAAYFAAKLATQRCEIWTGVPGMFTANPHQIPNARLLRTLDYGEAQEIASTGARILHPRCIPPLARANIPLHIRSTSHPEGSGTIVGARNLVSTPQVKAVSARKGIMLISMDTIGMWHQVGFLADVFAVFKRHGRSIDLLSTSETNVTVSLDPTIPLEGAEPLALLLSDLRPYCSARAIGPCAAVSLVGDRIRALLHRLGPALEVFEEQEIHLVSQAASDLNLTFVVNEDQAERLVTRLHNELVTADGNDAVMGATWQSLCRNEDRPPATPRWWHGDPNQIVALADHGTPTYVYDAASVRQACSDLVAMKHVNRLFYAVKANAHPQLLRLIVAQGLGLECVSPGEIDHCLASVPDLLPDQILFTPNFAPRTEYEAAFARGVGVTLDNTEPLDAWPDVFRHREIKVRIDPGQGRGHHRYVRTAGAISKFGVAPDQLDALEQRIRALDVKVVGLHAHTGSGIRTPENWCDTALYLADVAQRFAEVTHLNLGGGLGVPEKSGQSPLDLAAVDATLAKVHTAYPQYDLWLEPGRYVVATAGILLVRVTQTKRKGEFMYVGVDTGMNSLIRPALYGSWHDIVNVSGLARNETEMVIATVVGPICETSDTLGHKRRLHAPREGDVLLVDVVGAYGRSMASNYNLRPPAREFVHNDAE